MSIDPKDIAKDAAMRRAQHGLPESYEQPCAGINKAVLDQAAAARKTYRADTPVSLQSIEGEDAVFVAAYLEAVKGDEQPLNAKEWGLGRGQAVITATLNAPREQPSQQPVELSQPDVAKKQALQYVDELVAELPTISILGACKALAIKAAITKTPERESVDDAMVVRAIKAHDGLKYPSHECAECDGTGREHDDTPCSNPNYASKCGSCGGTGKFEKLPSQFQRFRAALNAAINQIEGGKS